MKKKIVGIFVCMLLIMTVVPISAQMTTGRERKNISEKSKNGGWYKTYGGNGQDLFYGLEITTEGNYIVTGQTEIDGNIDAWVLLIDPDGAIIRETTFGNPDGTDGAWGVTETSDGGYVCAAWYYRNESGLLDAMMVKLDENLNILWSNLYGTVDKMDDAMDIIETSDGYVMIGYFNNQQEVFVLKTDFDGNEIFTKTYQKDKNQHIVEILQDGDNFAIAGCAWPTWNIVDAWFLKIDSSGNEILSKEFGKLLSCDMFLSIDKTSDGNYILVGGTNGGIICGIWGTYILLMKLDENGNEIWKKKIGLPYFTDYSLSIRETEDEGFIITGHMYGIGNLFSFGASGWPLWSKICLIKTDSEGNVEWQKLMPGDGHGRTAREIDDGYILCGYTGNEADSEHAVLIKTDKNGKI